MSGGWQVGIDIGGTFTDVVARHPASLDLRSAKVATRIDDRVAGLLAALAAVDLDWGEVADLILGTTMVTNAIVEQNLAKVALVTTEGFCDTLAIGRQNRRHLYHLDPPAKLPPQVPADRRFEVVERISHKGEVLCPLDRTGLEQLVDEIAATGVKAVAVCLLHSYANPAHEQALGQYLRAHFPFVALSHQVNPEAREFERTATTVLSASVMPLAASHLDRLDAIKPKEARLHLFHSAGGMAAPETLRDLPLGLAMSGPAAGVAAAGQIARHLGIKQALSFDMGGTTTDVCLITDGQAMVSSNRALGGRPMRQPMVAVHSIGAGGGSIARLDHGALRVGPESAGADPGPACYGKGGALPTVSDANLVLGYLDKDRVLGDGLGLDAGAAHAAIAPLAKAMGMRVKAAALGIIRVANSTMVRALRRITVEEGIDGRACTLLAFGGAGPMHAVDIAREFGVGKVVVPACSSMFSALGCVSAHMSYTRQQTLGMTSPDWDMRRLSKLRKGLRSGLAHALAAPLKAAGLGAEHIKITEVALMRYRGQSYAIEVPDPAFDDPLVLAAAFRALHTRLYGFATDEPWEVEAVRMTASLPRPDLRFPKNPATNSAATPLKTSLCRFEGSAAVPTPRYDRSSLKPGQTIHGPLVVEDNFSTVVIPPNASLCADKDGNLVINTGASDARP